MELGLVTVAPDDLDWEDEIRIAIEERASLSPDALTGMEASLRFPGAETTGNESLRPALRLAELDFHPPQRHRRTWRAKTFRQRVESEIRPGACVMESNYQDRIPNNVSLGSNRTLQRALEHWQPEFLNWWHGLGPSDFNASDVYLRTAISVDTKGWATFGYVRMPDYRWGIFLATRKKPIAASVSATTSASRSGSRFPANIAPRCAA